MVNGHAWPLYLSGYVRLWDRLTIHLKEPSHFSLKVSGGTWDGDLTILDRSFCCGSVVSGTSMSVPSEQCRAAAEEMKKLIDEKMSQCTAGAQRLEMKAQSLEQDNDVLNKKHANAVKETLETKQKLEEAEKRAAAESQRAAEAERRQTAAEEKVEQKRQRIQQLL